MNQIAKSLLGIGLILKLSALPCVAVGDGVSEKKTVSLERLPGAGTRIASPAKSEQHPDRVYHVTAWFEEQLLGDGGAYERRAKEFSRDSGWGRQKLREETIAVLKSASEKSFAEATPSIEKLVKEGVLRGVERHWIVNGFSGAMLGRDLERLKEVKGVREVFVTKEREPESQASYPAVFATEVPSSHEISYQGLPWYITQLHADRVWKELGVTGEGTLNVIQDGHFALSSHLNRTVYRNPKEIPGNGIDDDKNGYVDDYHGFNFDKGTAQLHTRALTGSANDKRILHGTSCANIVSGSGDGKSRAVFGVAPGSQWAGVINNSVGIERTVEWAIEQGADTYSMSFTRIHFGDFRSHWRKMVEHGNFCGLLFVSGAGNRRNQLPDPFEMHVPQSIPNAVFAAAGVHRDFEKTAFSCVGPVTWDTQHYNEGVVQKPEVCAFNFEVPCQMPDGQVNTAYLYGNSYAGPMFCGAISLMLSADPDLLPWDLKEIIMSTARDVGPKGIDYETGSGLIDCFAAVQEVLARKPQ